MNDFRCECGFILHTENGRCWVCVPATDEELAAANRAQAVEEYGRREVEQWEADDLAEGRVFNWVAWPNFGDERDDAPLFPLRD